MKKLLCALVVLSVILLITGFLPYTSPVWSDGQNATYVIGQPDFYHKNQAQNTISMCSPNAVAIDVIHSKLYVTHNGRVVRFAYPITYNQPAAEIVIGQSDFTGWSPAAERNVLWNPHGVAVDDTGRLWVADTNNSRIMWFNNAYAINSNQPDADGVLGQIDYTHGECANTRNNFCYPTAITVSPNGTLFVADEQNNRVLRFDDAARKINGADADAVLGQTNFVSNTAALSQNGMSKPRSVAFYKSFLFVADSHNARILRFDNVFDKPDGANADGVLGASDFSSSWWVPTSPWEFVTGEPSGLALDSVGRLYAVNPNYHRVQVFNDATQKPNGSNADNVLGQIDFFSYLPSIGPNRLDLDNYNTGIAVDSVNNLLLVGDYGNNRVMVYRALGSLGLNIYFPIIFR